jgi:hypothetical protein
MRCAIRTRSLIAPTAVPNVGDDPQIPRITAPGADQIPVRVAAARLGHSFVSQASGVGKSSLRPAISKFESYQAALSSL